MWPSENFLSDLSEVWYVGRGWWVVHDGMSYGPIQGQDQGHMALKVRNSSIFKIYLVHHFQWELANDCWFLNYRTMSKFNQARFLMSLLVFVSCDFELGRKSKCGLRKKFLCDLFLAHRRSWPSEPHEANFFVNKNITLDNKFLK